MRFWSKLLSVVRRDNDKSRIAKRLHEQEPSDNDFDGIAESLVKHFICVVGSQSFPFDETDAIKAYSAKNPSWPRTHQIPLLRSTDDLPPGLDSLKDLVAVLWQERTSLEGNELIVQGLNMRLSTGKRLYHSVSQPFLMEKEKENPRSTLLT